MDEERRPGPRKARTSTVIYRLLADLVLALHLAFVVFVVFGGVLVIRRRWVAWIHLPAAAWGVAIELVGWVCPLTPLENRLRRAAGGGGYEGGFLEHYIMPVLYPAEMTRDLQLVLAALAVVINALIYTWVVLTWRSRRDSSTR